MFALVITAPATLIYLPRSSFCLRLKRYKGGTLTNHQRKVVAKPRPLFSGCCREWNLSRAGVNAAIAALVAAVTPRPSLNL
jgi:hypothetical protein